MNTVEELILRKSEAITKAEAKRDVFLKNIERKHRIIAEKQAEIAKVEAGIADKQEQADEAQAYVDSQLDAKTRIEAQAQMWNEAQERLNDLSVVFDVFTDMIRHKPSVKRDGTEVGGFTYDALIWEMDQQRAAKALAETNAKAIFYGKR